MSYFTAVLAREGTAWAAHDLEVEVAADLDELADLGTGPDTLQEMCDDEVLPMDALAAVAERAGFAEVLDALR